MRYLIRLTTAFKEVAQLINEDTAFVRSPEIADKENGEFALIVIVGNLSFLESTFEAEEAARNRTDYF
jgi:hypothetical protein